MCGQRLRYRLMLREPKESGARIHVYQCYRDGFFT